MSESPNKKLAELLGQAGTAHHAFEEEELNGETDEDWPRWYAAYLIEEGITTFFQPPPGLEDLAEQLDLITKKHSEDDPEGDWYGFAANALMQHFS